MMHESSTLEVDQIHKFIRGMKVLADREGMSIDELAEQAGLDVKDLNYLIQGQDDLVTLEITDGLLLKLADELGYNSVDDVINEG